VVLSQSPASSQKHTYEPSPLIRWRKPPTLFSVPNDTSYMSHMLDLSVTVGYYLL
jgi:hypothetical protein